MATTKNATKAARLAALVSSIESGVINKEIKMKFTPFLSNEHFCRIAEILRFAQSQGWRKAHPRCASVTLVDNITKVIRVDGDMDWNITQVAEALTDALVKITQADERLWYTTEDMDWLLSVLDRPQSERGAIIWLMMAWASAPDERVTPIEAAEISGEADSTWRNRCSSGEVIGAIKYGKQWTIPKSIVKSFNSQPQ